MSDETHRTRTYEWSDPAELARVAREMSGHEYFAAWSKGELVPPIAATLGFELASYRDGHVEISSVPEEFQYSPYGMLHGGLAATLLDTATGCAIHTRLPAGTGYATLNLNLSYLRPITIETGPVRCLGRVSSMGSRVAVAEAELLDARGQSLAQATSTCLIIRPD